ncbi:hypothetical protein A1Q2_02682 [Trichosporon asahii var. asahii CBS 8904]|uniref:Uncharacterized protein n=1 Tax=Trichosporon asahii var. asahii (strain CBS 8904) TaxID=1220162 RepID=K1VTZ1_TRIAC|nr:hypothetical protein A1Q2_02682 [Trichosporon asahii var. asahii CBS 8904]
MLPPNPDLAPRPLSGQRGRFGAPTTPGNGGRGGDSVRVHGGGGNPAPGTQHGYANDQQQGYINAGYHARGGHAGQAGNKGGWGHGYDRGHTHRGFSNHRGRGGSFRGGPPPSPTTRRDIPASNSTVTPGYSASAPPSLHGSRAPSRAEPHAPPPAPSRPGTADPTMVQWFQTAPSRPASAAPRTQVEPIETIEWSDMPDSREPSRAPSRAASHAGSAPGTVLFSTQGQRGLGSGGLSTAGYTVATATPPSLQGSAWNAPLRFDQGPRAAPRGRGDYGRGRGGRFSFQDIDQPGFYNRSSNVNRFDNTPNYSYPNYRGRGRGRGRGKLWIPRNPLTPEALGSLKDDSYAATGTLGNWARQTRPLSPPLEEEDSRPSTPFSLPPTPQDSPHAPSTAQPHLGAKLDASAYPHIFDQIFALTPHAGLLVLRLVNRAVKDRVDARLFRHVLLCTPERASGLVLLSPWGDRLPFVPWDLDPAPAPDHRDYDDPIEEYFGPLKEEGDDTAALDAAYFSRMAQLRHVRVLDFYSTKSRIKQLALGLKDVQLVRSKPDWHWERHPRKWRVQAPTFVSYLNLVQSWAEFDDAGGWGLEFADGQLASPFAFLIPRAQHAVLHLHYDSERGLLPTRFRCLPDLESLTLVWHNAAGGEADASQLVEIVQGLPMLNLTLVGLEPRNMLQAGDWTAPIYTRLDQLGTPNFRHVRIMARRAWEEGADPLIGQDALTYTQPYIPVNQDFGWDSDDEAFARKYYRPEPEGVAEESDVESDA